MAEKEFARGVNGGLNCPSSSLEGPCRLPARPWRPSGRVRLSSVDMADSPCSRKMWKRSFKVGGREASSFESGFVVKLCKDEAVFLRGLVGLEGDVALRARENQAKGLETFRVVGGFSTVGETM